MVNNLLFKNIVIIVILTTSAGYLINYTLNSKGIEYINNYLDNNNFNIGIVKVENKEINKEDTSVSNICKSNNNENKANISNNDNSYKYNNNYNNMNNIGNINSNNDNYENKDYNNVDLSSKLNWYIFEKAMIHHLNKKYINELSEDFTKLKDKNILYTSWNIGKWEDDNIKYNYNKCNFNSCITYYTENGKIVKIEVNENSKIQTPKETIIKKTGICSDYAILTGALLIKCGYNEIYFFDVKFDNEVGHVFTAVKYNNIFYAIDQHTIITNIYEHLRKLEKEYGKIKKIKYYKLKNNNGEITYKEYNYNDKIVKIPKISNENFENILLNKLLKKYPNLKSDKNIDNLDKMKYLPEGYSNGITYTMEFSNLKLDNNLKDKLAEHIINSFISKVNFLKYNCIWANVKDENNKITVKIYLAKK